MAYVLLQNLRKNCPNVKIHSTFLSSVFRKLHYVRQVRTCRPTSEPLQTETKITTYASAVPDGVRPRISINTFIYRHERVRH